MKKLITLVVVASVAAVWVGPAWANLLTNPGAETGSLAPWAGSAGVVVVTSVATSSGTFEPNSGDYLFRVDGVTTTSFLSQEVSLAGVTEDFLLAGGRIATELWPSDTSAAITDNDYGVVSLEFLDGSDQSLGTVSGDPIGNPTAGSDFVGSAAYVDFSLLAAIPDGAAKVIYKITGNLVDGTVVDVMVDDMTLVETPEPVTLLVLALGLVPFLLTRRQRA